MASFNDVLAVQITARTPGGTCSVLKWRETLNEQDRKQFDQASDDTDIPHSVLHRAMKELGFTMSPSAVQRHRTKGCRCADL